MPNFTNGETPFFDPSRSEGESFMATVTQQMNKSEAIRGAAADLDRRAQKVSAGTVYDWLTERYPSQEWNKNVISTVLVKWRKSEKGYDQQEEEVAGGMIPSKPLQGDRDGARVGESEVLINKEQAPVDVVRCVELASELRRAVGAEMAKRLIDTLVK